MIWAVLTSPLTGIALNALGLAAQLFIAWRVRRYVVTEFTALGIARREYGALMQRDAIERIRQLAAARSGQPVLPGAAS